MFTLKLYDRKGEELNLGDIVKISDGKRFNFYARVTYLEDEQSIAPFHTFSFHSFEKVTKLPKGAEKSKEGRYDIWWPQNENDDATAKDFQEYLSSWRECERQLEKGCWRILPTKKIKRP